MKRIVIILIFLTNIAAAQENAVRLEDCYENMMNYYPLANQNEVYTKSNDLNIKNIHSGWLPTANLNARATYQSDAIEVNISAMGNDLGFSADRDQYKATIDLNQLIYDWGRIKANIQRENSSYQVNQQNLQVELNKIKDQVNRFFFAILTLEKNKSLLEAMLNDLETREKSVESAVKNGVLLNSDLSAVKAEKIKVKQNITEISNQRLAAIQILAEITGMDLSSDSQFELPQMDLNENDSLTRPEYKLFDLQLDQIDANAHLISKQNKPMIFSFAQVGYGKPGLNMVNTDFNSFYIVGAGLSWNFWDWNQTKRKKEAALLNKDLVKSKRETFDKQINVAVDNLQANIATLQSAVIGDKEIIKLREEVTESARTKLENGVITSSDYIKELTSETQAKINFETHKIKLQQAKVDYLYIKGNL